MCGGGAPLIFTIYKKKYFYTLYTLGEIYFDPLEIGLANSPLAVCLSEAELLKKCFKIGLSKKKGNGGGTFVRRCMHLKARAQGVKPFNIFFHKGYLVVYFHDISFLGKGSCTKQNYFIFICKYLFLRKLYPHTL